MEQASEAKSARMLDIYARLMAGQVLNKTALAEEYGVTLRSIQRDMESLRFFLMEKGLPQEVIYDRSMKGYRMVNSVPSGLSNSETLAVCKILLESRSMRRDEMLPILDKLVECAVPQEQRRAVKELIDTAIAKSQGGIRKFKRNISKKRTDHDGYIVLYEKDFVK